MNLYHVINPIDLNYGGIVKEIYDESSLGQTIRIEVVKAGIEPRSRAGSKWFTPRYVLRQVKPMNRRYD